MNLLPTQRPVRPWYADVSEALNSFPPTHLMFDRHLIRVEDEVLDGLYTIRAELPGLDPDRDLDITVNQGVLTIKAERTERKTSTTRSEFAYGCFERSLSLPDGADEDGITADYSTGVLTLTIPVTDSSAPAPRRIGIPNGKAAHN